MRPKTKEEKDEEAMDEFAMNCMDDEEWMILDEYHKPLRDDDEPLFNFDEDF